MDPLVYLQSFESFAGAIVAAGTVVLILMLVAMGVYAYKHIKGDGVTWPDEKETRQEFGDGEPAGANGLEKGDEDDEWDYY